MVVHIADKSSRKWTIGKVLFGTCNTYGNVKHVRDKTSSWFRQIAYTGDVKIHTSHQTHLIKGHHMINFCIYWIVKYRYLQQKEDGHRHLPMAFTK